MYIHNVIVINVLLHFAFIYQLRNWRTNVAKKKIFKDDGLIICSSI